MTRVRANGWKKLLQAVGCLLCAVAAWNSSTDFIGTEFGSGAVTGPVLDASLIGAFLYLLALVATVALPRVAGASASMAALFCLPLYIYRTLPRLFVQISGGEWKDPPQGVFVWHGWSMTGFLVSILVVYLCSRSLCRCGTAGNANIR
jgi:hypothetical protein